MKIDNFKLVRVEGKNCLDWVAHATVDVKKMFKKKETVEVSKRWIGNWFFVETGEFTPRYFVENLERSWEAKNGTMFVKKTRDF